MLTVTPLPAFQDNYIWALTCNGHTVVVDPGDAIPVKTYLDQTGTRLEAILVTHHHRDHTGGLANLRAATGCRVFGPNDIAAASDVLTGGERLELPGTGLIFDVHATPGHTLDHLSYYGANHLFCGDTLFGCGCGRLFEGTPEMMVNSFATLLALPDDTRVCPAHEYTLDNEDWALTADPDNAALLARAHADRETRFAGRPTLPSSLALEKATNPFLRGDSATLDALVRHELGRPPHDAAEAFAVIRAHKDRYDSQH